MAAGGVTAGLAGGSGGFSAGGGVSTGVAAGVVTGAGAGVAAGGAPTRIDSQAARAHRAQATVMRRSMIVKARGTMRRSISQGLRENSQSAVMFWLIVEAGVALAVLLFIVWWTWPRTPRHKDTPPDE